MDDNKQNSFRMPMIEMIIIIGIFAIISVLIVRMFISTDHLQGKAVNVSRSVMEAESIAEYIKGSDSSSNIWEELGAEKLEETQDSYVIYYDREWNKVEKDASNIIVIHTFEEIDEYGSMSTYQILAYDKESLSMITEQDIALCELTVKNYQNNDISLERNH